MKRIFITGFAILLATAAVQAQTTDTTKAPHYQHQKAQKDGAYKQLDLSSDQQAKLKTMRENFKQQADAIKAQKLTDAERKTQMQQLHEQQRTQMESIFTPAQKEQWEKMKTDRKDDMRNGKRMKGDSSMSKRGKEMKSRGSKDGQNLQKDLNLTSEQQAKMNEIRTGFKTKAETLRNDQALTQDQKKERLQELRKEQQEQMKTVLTKEQQEKMQSLRKERPARNTK